MIRQSLRKNQYKVNIIRGEILVFSMFVFTRFWFFKESEIRYAKPNKNTYIYILLFGYGDNKDSLLKSLKIFCDLVFEI